jgi:hypothetical protein
MRGNGLRGSFTAIHGREQSQYVRFKSLQIEQQVGADAGESYNDS